MESRGRKSGRLASSVRSWRLYGDISTGRRLANDAFGAGLCVYGQNVARAAAAGSTQDENDITQLQKEKLRAEIAETEARTRKLNADTWNPGAAMAFPMVGDRPIGLPGDIQPWQVTSLGQDIRTRAGANPDGIPAVGYGDSHRGRVNPKANDQPSNRPGFDFIQSNMPPGYVMMNTGPGFSRLMPAGNDPWEIWAELPWYEKARILNQSAGVSGDRYDFWKRYLQSEVFGRSPVFRQEKAPIRWQPNEWMFPR